MELLRWRAAKIGDKRGFTYVEDGERKETHLTYSELDVRARMVAAQLQQIAHARHGERAILLYPPGLDALPAFFGCQYAGVVAVPVIPPRPGQPPRDILAIAKDSQPRMLLTSTCMLPVAQTLAGMIPDIIVITTDTLELALADAWQPPQVNPDDLAFLHFTSGSTKAPRGIMFDHRRVLALLYTQAAIIQDNWATLVSWAPLYTGMGLFGGAIEPLQLGVQAVMMSPLDFSTKPARWLHLIARYPQVLSGGPNFCFQLLVDRVTPAECEGLDLSSWVLMHCGAEPIRERTLSAFAAKYAPYGLSADAFLTTYGLSEAMMSVSTRLGPVQALTLDRVEMEKRHVKRLAKGNPAGQLFVNCGKPYEGETVTIVNPDTLLPAGPDEIGEIWVSGPNILAGYWRQPAETEAVFGAHMADGSGPYLRTGDLGFVQDGGLYITGRAKDVIILHGRNIYALDIEQSAELAHPALQQAASAAFGITENDEEHLVLVMEVKASVSNPDMDEIAHAVRRAIAEDHQLPVHSVALVEANSIPRTTSGKVQRYKARESFLEQMAA
jgi:acyl-CoA synthetase (AMP-forming)/AMP-acid ligase II